MAYNFKSIADVEVVAEPAERSRISWYLELETRHIVKKGAVLCHLHFLV